MTPWTICSLPGFSIHGILQARILQWVAISFSRGSSPPRDQIHFSCTAGIFFTTEPPRKSNIAVMDVKSVLPPFSRRSCQDIAPPPRRPEQASTPASPTRGQTHLTACGTEYTNRAGPTLGPRPLAPGWWQVGVLMGQQNVPQRRHFSQGQGT